MSFFARLFGRRQGGSHSAARPHARRGEQPAGAPATEAGRPLFRDEVDGQAGGIGSQAPAAQAAGTPCGRCGSRNAPSSRYCSQCGGDLCYCPEHLQNHDHVPAAAGEATPSS